MYCYSYSIRLLEHKISIAIVRTFAYNKDRWKYYSRKEMFYMATKSANLYARIEPDVKEKAESILSTLGIGSGSLTNLPKQKTSSIFGGYTPKPL